jgi:lipopolysaccharide/colanic/teichoic acid biosynthesis glycosyltransferase
MYRKFFKRYFDITLSFTALVVLLPLLIPVIAGLLLTGEHYVFYFQERVGYRNRRFSIWKFATMLKDSPNLPGGVYTTRRDPRLMPLGGFLRKTKINEIPQLVDILKGDMSIIGPRPHVRKTFEAFPENVKASIYNVRPGLTGIGSIVFRDEEKLFSGTTLDHLEFDRLYIAPYKGELELWYQEHVLFFTDFMLVFLTAWVIFFPQSDLVYRIFKDLPERPEFLR